MRGPFVFDADCLTGERMSSEAFCKRSVASTQLALQSRSSLIVSTPLHDYLAEHTPPLNYGTWDKLTGLVIGSVFLALFALRQCALWRRRFLLRRFGGGCWA